MKNILAEIAACKICEPFLDLGANPVVSMSKQSKIIIIGQAPGTKVHVTGIPWNDPSGVQLRKWLNVDTELFYNTTIFGIMPMGFCYPGKGKSGDLPPRAECAPKWHNKLLDQLENPAIILLIGKYAQDYYLGEKSNKTLTENVKGFKSFQPKYFPLPHPSPRNRFWLKKNEWFEREVIPELQRSIAPFL